MKFTARSRIEAPASEVYAWHARPGAFERLAPPWEKIEVLERPDGVKEGGRLAIRVSSGPSSKRWVCAFRAVREGLQFVDEQVEGPFARWVHAHRFEPDGAGACFLEDRIQCELPMGWLGRMGEGAVLARLRRAFEYRHAVTKEDLFRHRSAGGKGPWRVAVTGSSGLVGSALVPFLTSGGHQVLRLVHGKDWNPEEGRLDPAALEGVDAVVHLAGENIASGRWTASRKRSILKSREEGTRLVAEILARLERPPRVLISASAVGYYGDRKDSVMDEVSPPGKGYLPEVCQAWEDATAAARRRGIRVVNLRIGIVLSPAGGALGKMLTPFRMGVGGVVGSGKQPMSWISIDDLVGVIHFALSSEALFGPVNAVAPGAVANEEFTRVLGRVLGRPTAVALPAPVVWLMFGEMGSTLLLRGARVRPRRLEEAGFRFHHPDLEKALRHVLGRREAAQASSLPIGIG